jgi:CheY-like chemotaxis protein
MTSPRPLIAILDSSPDTVDMLRVVLEGAGFATVSVYTHEIRDGKVDLAAFMIQHRPAVVIYDVAPPYHRNWDLFQQIRAEPVMADCRFVITSTNAPLVQRLVGPEARVLEIIGKPYDLDAIVVETQRAPTPT